MCMLARITQEREETDDAEGREKGQWGCEVLKASMVWGQVPRWTVDLGEEQEESL